MGVADTSVAFFYPSQYGNILLKQEEIAMAPTEPSDREDDYFLGLESYDLVKSYHKKWVEEYLGNEKKILKTNGAIASPLGAEALWRLGAEGVSGLNI